VRQWRQPVVPRPNAEIIATGFYAPDALPADTTPGTRRRVAEICAGRIRGTEW
jgi:hypothetical protein